MWTVVIVAAMFVIVALITVSKDLKELLSP